METSAQSAYDSAGRRKYLSRAEGQKFIEHAALCPKLHAVFCLTVYYTGCRISEALSIRRCDIDREMKALLIRTLKRRGKVHVRRIPIPESLAGELFGLPIAIEEARIWGFSRTTGWRIIKKVMQNAGVSGVHAAPKGLRHGFGVRSAMNEIPLSLIQHWLGHACPSTTAIYLSVQDEEERALIRKTW